MKVKELIEGLQKLNPELEVISAKDDEGNGYNFLSSPPMEAYSPDLEQSWIDDVWYRDWAQDYEDEYSEEMPPNNCVVI